MLIVNFKSVLPLLVGFAIALSGNFYLAELKPTSVLANQPVAEIRKTVPQPFFPQLTPTTKERAFPEALVEGMLTLNNGCLRVVQDNQIDYLIIWSPQVRIELSDKSIQVFDEKSQVTAQVGQTVQLGGGQIPTSASILKELRQPLPKNCSGPYWLASGIVPPQK